MSDSTASENLLEALPRALQIAVRDAAEQAVLMVYGATGQLLNHPAQTPAEAEAWQAALLTEALSRPFQLWVALDEAQLRAAGGVMLHTVLWHIIAQNQAGASWIRQNKVALPALTGAAPPSAPGAR